MAVKDRHGQPGVKGFRCIGRGDDDFRRAHGIDHMLAVVVGRAGNGDAVPRAEHMRHAGGQILRQPDFTAAGQQGQRHLAVSPVHGITPDIAGAAPRRVGVGGRFRHKGRGEDKGVRAAALGQHIGAVIVVPYTLIRSPGTKGEFSAASVTVPSLLSLTAPAERARGVSFVAAVVPHMARKISPMCGELAPMATCPLGEGRPRNGLPAPRLPVMTLRWFFEVPVCRLSLAMGMT